MDKLRAKLEELLKAIKDQQKGVHLSTHPGFPGISTIGTQAKIEGSAASMKRGHQRKLTELKAMPKPKLTKDEGKGIWPAASGGVQQHPEPPKKPGDNKEAISTVKPGSNNVPYQAEGEPRVHHVNVKKYDPEKGMPETPVGRAKPSTKPMGSNEKPVRAVRHKTNTPTPEHKVGYGQEPAGPELPVRARWVGKADSQWSLDKANKVKVPKKLKPKDQPPNEDPSKCVGAQNCFCPTCRQNR
jgi:hypothetical protein